MIEEVRMLSWIRNFLWNETTFARSARSLLLFVGALLGFGVVSYDGVNNKVLFNPDPTKIIASFSAASAGMIAAGEKNPKKED